MSNPFRCNEELTIQRELAHAIRYDNYFEVKYLIEHAHADPCGYEYCADTAEELEAPFDDRGITIAEYTGMYCRNFYIYELLFEHGMSPTQALAGCMRKGLATYASLCLLRGADPNFKDKQGRPALYEYLSYLNGNATCTDFDMHLFIACLMYHHGYVDKGNKVQRLLKRSCNDKIKELLDVADTTPDDLAVMAEYVERAKVMQNLYYPNKCPENYITAAIFKNID